jgi:hypothetical protein
VFLSAVPFGLAAFVLTWFLKEVPLRQTVGLMSGVDKSFGFHDVGDAQIKEELAARRQAAEAALSRLDELAEQLDVPPEQVDELRQLYQARIDRLAEYREMLESRSSELSPAFRQMVLELLRTERAELERLDEQDGVSRSVAERVQRDLHMESADVGR